MSYKIIQTAYNRAYEFLKSLLERRGTSGYEILALHTGGPDAVFIKNPGVGAVSFVNNAERHLRRAVRVTQGNFNEMFPPPSPEQLKLDLEERLQ